MSTTLLAVVIALVLGHVASAQLVSLRRFHWYQSWLQWLGEQSGEGSFWRGRHGIVLALLPPLLLVALLQWSFASTLFGLVALLFAIVVLVYAWGPRDLDVDVEAIIDAHNPVARSQALLHLWNGQAPLRTDGGALVEAVFANALTRWFGTLFWFLLLGPVGALGYRLVALVAQGRFANDVPADTRAGAATLFAWLNWPVAQLMTLAMALVGNFDVVFNAWRAGGGSELHANAAFLFGAARASVRGELAEEAEEYAEEGMVPVLRELPELRDAMSLVWRILLVWLAVMALFVIGGWVS
ncbi:hypothetical protein [Pseudoxanthomonas dokdonensis]|uniref:Membrane protein n=1 Tax=Pseudoxanthomonas dokdonensis TaxID=344882 RepID=A0A0R0CNL3_9GAMM|nr:hypothetical protein [Pseudoxanthomonas dokdonensis]KRG71596.1 membrane protein [Pseudoxanthomonas dokdonensis]